MPPDTLVVIEIEAGGEFEMEIEGGEGGEFGDEGGGKKGGQKG